MDNKRIKTTELDFDSIKTNLKEYLKGQDQFSDYDFEGSGLSILLDILAYNTHYNGLYQNLAINEAFLDSAAKRDSVVSKAKELGYVPRSAKSATAVVDIVMLNSNIGAPEFIEIPRYTQFRSLVDGVNFSFFTTDSYLAYRQGTQYTFNGVVIKEGSFLQFRSEITNPQNISIRIPNPNVDLDTVRVVVQENAQSANSEIFYRSDSLLSIGPNSNVYFVKETDGGFYELEFGNGVIGKALEAGNIVIVDYISCNLDAPNGARTFLYNGTLATNTTVFVTTVSAASNGAPLEGIDSIRWNAPRLFTAQNRCVTLDDYRAIISSMYPNAESVNVWGGEQNIPPSYGDVFIAVKPESSETLSDAEKNYILNDVIGPRKLVTMHPKIVDPEYLYVELDTTVYFDKRKTSRTANEIISLVRDTIENYNDTKLNRFDGVLKSSILSREIDKSEKSIVSSISTMKIHREIRPQFNQLVQYKIDTGNPIFNAGGAEESIISTGINVINVPQICYIDDVSSLDSNLGTLRLFYMDSGRKVLVKNIGTVNYSTGLITLNDLVITGTASPSFKLIIKPQSFDIASVRNQVVSIRPELTSVTAVVETTADNYKFTSSRN